MRPKEGESVTKASYSQEIPGTDGFIYFREQKNIQIISDNRKKRKAILFYKLH